MRRVVRSSRRTPSAFSRFLIDSLTAGFSSAGLLAAPAKLPLSTTVTKIRIAFSRSTRSPLFGKSEQYFRRGVVYLAHGRQYSPPHSKTRVRRTSWRILVATTHSDVIVVGSGIAGLAAAAS